MAAPINSPSTGDIWHLCIDDLFAPLPDKTRLGGPGPFVINLSASTAPIDLPTGAIAGCQHGHVYQLQRTEDRRLRYRLRFGPIANEDEADAILERVRDIYPGALTATADADDLRAIATIQAKASAQRAAAPATVPLAPGGVQKPQPPMAEQSRESEMPIALAPPVLSMEQEVIRERAPAAAPVKPPQAAAAQPPVSAAPAAPPRNRVSAAVSMIPLLTTVATSSIKRVIVKPSASSAPVAPILTMACSQPKVPTAAVAPAARAVAPVPVAAPAAVAAPVPVAAPAAVAAPVPVAAPATVAVPAPVTAAPPTTTAPKTPAAPAVWLETTQTVRALTARELEDAESLRWFVIQLSMADEPFNSETVPNLDIFTLYRLYCVAGIDQGRVVHSLRLGFFSEEIAAGAVASYLAEFYENPTVKRVSVAERQRFAEHRFEPRKDVGATGKHAVIEITNERYIREKRTTAAAMHPPATQRNR
jgi:hypothetical protein